MTMKYEIFLLLFIVIGLVSAGTVEWELKDDKTTCVKVKFEGNLTVYNSSKNAMSFDVSKINSTIENGTCSGVAESTQNMTADLSKHGKLKFFFTRSKDKMVSLILQYTFQSKELFPDGTDNETVTLESGLVYGGIPATNAFRCYHMEEVNLTDTKSNYSGNLNTSDVTVQAFDIKDGKFGPADVCGDDKTSTSTASSTTAMSTTVAPPVMTTYSLKEKNKTCILLSAAIQFKVQYTTKDNKTGHGVFDIPENVTVTGACATNGSAMMVLSFGGGSRLTLSFTDDTKQKMSIIKEISTELDITKAIFPDAKNQTLNGSDEMKATFNDNTYYICLAGSTIMMKNISVSLGSGWKAQAFNLKNGNFSGEGDHCPADKSSSTTASTPITTPMPNPVNNYTVHGENNTICIFMKASMEFNVTYASTKQNMSKMVYIPSGAKASGNCKVSDDVESMTITFNDEMNAAKNEAELNLVFVMDKNNKYTISNFTLTMNSDVLPGAKMNETVVLEAANVNMFQAAKDGSYLCNSPTTVALSNNEKNATMFIQANLMVKDLKYKAFNSDNSTSFKDVVECSADNSTNSIVPIAVGAALAGLVIIVLIAYLIGRRRSKRYGYESV